MRRPSAGLVVASFALVVALAGTNAYATATTFLLNTSNTSSAQTTLKGSAIAGKALQITNANTGTGATALGLSVAKGHPPFTVNSNTQVPRLNASLLQGIPPAGFVQGSGSGTAVLSNRIVFGPGAGDTQVHETLLTIPGLGQLVAFCGGNPPFVEWDNTTTNSVDFWNTGTNFGGSISAGASMTIVTSNSPETTMVLGTGADPGPRIATTLTAFELQTVTGGACDFQSQGPIWDS